MKEYLSPSYHSSLQETNIYIDFKVPNKFFFWMCPIVDSFSRWSSHTWQKNQTKHMLHACNANINFGIGKKIRSKNNPIRSNKEYLSSSLFSMMTSWVHWDHLSKYVLPYFLLIFKLKLLIGLDKTIQLVMKLCLLSSNISTVRCRNCLLWIFTLPSKRM